MSVSVRVLGVGLPREISSALAVRLSGVTVTEAETFPEAVEAARVSSFDLIVVNDVTVPLEVGENLKALRDACGSRPFHLAYCTDAPPNPEVAERVRSSVHAERIFYRPFDLEEILREVARSVGVELYPPSAPPSGSGDAAAQLNAIWERFRGVTLGRIDVLESAALAVLENRLDEELRLAATREAHKLAGSSGTFGFPGASQLARGLEQRFMRTDLETSDAVLLSEQLILLRRDLEGTPSAPASTSSPRPAAGRRRVLVLDPEKRSRERLVMEAEGRAFATFEAESPAAARAAIPSFQPQAAILVFEHQSDNRDALALLEELQQMESPIPAVVVAPQGGLLDRVEIAKRGGSRRLELPVSPRAVIEALVVALTDLGDEQTTVLAVDDDPQILQSIDALLAPRGIRVVTVSDPLLFWDSLHAENPDLVILDIDMPHVSGLELCRALRNDERWATLPVLFLTSRTDAASVQRIFAAGADDHVGKPIAESELVMRLNNRMERVRQLRQQADSDPLTRVATRRKSLELMHRFFELARRTNTSYAVAIVDVDNIKSINSDYGNSAGDDVLRSLAQLLTRSLRAEDIIGRWGADEFIVGFYGSTRKEAGVRLKTILADFSARIFRSGESGSFQASFSAGVSQLPDDGDGPEALVAAAEGALGAPHDHTEKVRCTNADDLATLEHVDIALVEDDEALVGLLKHGLQTAGFRVRSFGDGEEAVTALAGKNPTLRARLIILDVDLPALNGYDVLRRLRKDGVTKASRVIMLTARNAEDDVLSGLGMGAIDHVNKPFSLPVLIQKVNSALDSGSG